MFANKETVFYILLGIALLFLAFSPISYFDNVIQFDLFTLNLRMIIFVTGIFILIFPPSESIRISSVGKWIINLINTIFGRKTEPDEIIENQNIEEPETKQPAKKKK